MKNRYKAMLGLVLLSFVLSGCTTHAKAKPDSAVNSTSTVESAKESQAGSETHEITDMKGNKIKLPTKIVRYGESWFAHNAVDAMLGTTDKMVATNVTPDAYPWMYLVAPDMKDALHSFGTDFNLEALVARKPQVVFASTDANDKKLASVGIPVVNVMFSNYDEMKKSVMITGEVFGGESAKQAQNFVNYLDSNIALVTKKVGSLSDSQKPTVLHMNSASGMTADGSGTIIDTWIKLGGGKNAASDIKGNLKKVSMEQILAWNPEVIIVTNQKDVDYIMKDSSWANITAVKNKAVYINPKGVFSWDRYGVESALQIVWAAKLLHPEFFKDVNISDNVKQFYKNFFNYELTDQQVTKILHAKKPN